MFNKNRKTMKYKITVEEVAGDQQLVFETEQKENILEIAEKLKHHSDFDEEDAVALGIGLKLFSGVMMKNKNNPIFKDLLPSFKTFMKGLKGGMKR